MSIDLRREDPPAATTGGRRVNEELMDAMRVIAGDPNNWYHVMVYPNAGSARSAANRLRKRDWNDLLGLRGGDWEVVTRDSDVYAMRTVRR